jgi:hypothetical protein
MNCRSDTYALEYTSNNMLVDAKQAREKVTTLPSSPPHPLYLETCVQSKRGMKVHLRRYYSVMKSWWWIVGYYLVIRFHNEWPKGNSPPASLLVAILQSTSAPFAASDTLSTETYFPLTVPASLPCLGGQSGCSKGRETAHQFWYWRQTYCSWNTSVLVDPASIP